MGACRHNLRRVVSHGPDDPDDATAMRLYYSYPAAAPPAIAPAHSSSPAASAADAVVERCRRDHPDLLRWFRGIHRVNAELVVRGVDPLMPVHHCLAPATDDDDAASTCTFVVDEHAPPGEFSDIDSCSTSSVVSRDSAVDMLCTRDMIDLAADDPSAVPVGPLIYSSGRQRRFPPTPPAVD